jgi:hypothetical protein
MSLTPHVVDLIPSSSWCASLANMLTASSWKLIRDVCTLRAGSCAECGAMATPLECHEIWTYDEESGIQTLVELRAVCGPCHETHHLGLASIRGVYDRTMLRLAALNRLMPHEIADYEAEVFSRFERRSLIAWTLDLSMMASNPMSLKKAFVMAEDGSIEGTGRQSGVRTRIVGLSIDRSGSGIVLS